MIMRPSEKILADIDDTLDQLIENADVLKRISPTPLYTSEIEALQKTQESLLARLVHMNDLLKNHKKEEDREPFESIEKKILRFGKLNARIIHHAAARIKRSKKNRYSHLRVHRRKSEF